MSYKPKSRKSINASSMADIAFLLLIFFLVTTTMDIDKGILVILPPPGSDTSAPISQRNVLEIFVNAHDELLVENKRADMADLKSLCIKHVNNRGELPDFSESPQKAVISLANDVSTSYGEYIAIQNEIRAAYNEMRNKAAQNQFGKNFKELSKENRRTIKEIYPIKLSEAEPKDFARK